MIVGIGRNAEAYGEPSASRELAGFFHFKDFTSLVVPTLWAGAMWHLLLVTVRTLGKRVRG
jgi:hypothetical protein